MPFTLLPLTPTDAPACVTIYFAAFQNPHSLACWPRTPSVRVWWETMILDELQDPSAHFFKLVDSDSEKIVGWTKWVEPKPGQRPSEELPEWPAEADTRLCDETFGAWARWHPRLMGDRGHWYLEMVAVHPDFQGRGAGSQMLRWGTEKADEQGVEAYLEASPEAVMLYEKFGFCEARKEVTWIENGRVNGTWYTNMYMIRPAKGNETIH